MRLLCVILDGMSKRAFESLKSIENSSLGSILRNSAETEIVSSFPSETAAANATMLTGRSPGEHGLVGNEFFLNDNFLRISFDLKTDAPSLLHFVNHSCLDMNIPTIFEVMEDKGLKTAAIHAIYRGAGTAAPDFFVNRKKKWKYRRVFASFLARYQIFGAKGINNMNRFVIELAAKIVRSENPDFMILWIPFMDKIAHDYSFETSLQTLVELDRSFQTLLDLINESEIVIMSDHGHSRTPKKVDLVGELLKRGIKANYMPGRGLLHPVGDVLVSQNGRTVFIKCSDKNSIEKVIKILILIPEIDQVIHNGELHKGHFGERYPLAAERLQDLISGKYACRTGDIIVTFKPHSTIQHKGKAQNQHSSMHVVDSIAPFYVFGVDDVKIKTMKEVFAYLLKLVER